MSVSVAEILGASRRASLGGLATDGTTLDAIGLGRITVSAVAAEVSRATGTTTTTAAILARAKAAGMMDPDSGGTAEDRTLVAFARGMLNGEGADSAVALVRPAVRAAGGSEGLAALIEASVRVGGTEALAAVGRAVVEGGLSGLRAAGGALVGFLESVLGSAGTGNLLSSLSAAVSAAMENIAPAVAVIGPMFQFAQALSSWVGTMFDVEHGATLPASRWAVDAKDLYVWLCESADLPVPAADSAWTCTFNPFFQEVFLWHAHADDAFQPFRALDAAKFKVSGVRLPDWREQFASPAAHLYIQSGGGPVAPGRRAEHVTGCECGSGGMITPWWWRQGRPEWRAAMVASCYVGVGCGCMKGLGTWRGTEGRAVANPYGDPRWYVDDQKYYDLGYSPDPRTTTWWSGWDSDRRKVRLIPPGMPSYGSHGGATRCDFDPERDRGFVRAYLDAPISYHDLGMQPNHPMLPKMTPASPSRFMKPLSERRMVTQRQAETTRLSAQPPGWSTGTKVAVSVGGAAAGGFALWGLGKWLGWWK